MLVHITRASDWEETDPPISEARKTKAKAIDNRVCDTPEELPGGALDWYSKGKNHQRLLSGGITRELDMRELWVVEIKDLGQLLSLIEKEGPVVLSQCTEWKGITYTLQIYDALIE